jgi:transcriptional regulator with XRE-family HTH domain
LKNSKEELRSLINDLKNSTGLTQEQLSVAAGYSAKTLTQALSKKEGHDAVMKQLKLIDWGKVDKTLLETVDNKNSKSTVESTNGNISKDEYIQALKDQIETLKKTNERLNNYCDFLEKRVVANFDAVLKNQVIVQAQVAAASRRAAERHAGNDKKKLQEEYRMIDKYVAERSREILEMDNRL